jgi:hypothetical protein
MTLIPAGTRFEGIPASTNIYLRSEQINESLTVYTMDDIAATVAADLPPSGLEGTSFILVKGEGTAEENGLELQAAYDAAQLATPYGDALSTLNRFTIIVAPGDYYSDYVDPIFGPIGQFNIDADFIDIKSLTGDADVFLSGITVSAQDVYLKGLNTTQAISLGGACNAFALNTITSNAEVTCDTCVGGDYSFGAGGIVSGTFINCIAGNVSYASLTGGATPIGVNVLGFACEASGTFTNCVGGSTCFGSLPLFGSGNVSGTITNCTAGDNSFGFSQITGVLRNCIGGAESFTSQNAFGTVAGTIFNCTAQLMSFGRNITGYEYYCKLYGSGPSTGAFSVSTGKVVACIDYSDTLINL